MTHIIEFDRLTKAEMLRLLKWCKTCCFKHWNTHIDNNGYRFLFESRHDADLFIMTHSDYFSNDYYI